MPPPLITDPSKQFPFTEGPGIESFTFDEVYNGLGIKDADTVDTDQGSLWQVSWCTFPYGNIYIYITHMYKAGILVHISMCSLFSSPWYWHESLVIHRAP